GENVFQLFVNPLLLPEEYYNNNLLEAGFKVNADRTNPLLDVTFDGQHIMDGDIVSPNPLIAISLRDENTVMIKTDTTGMFLYHKRPCVGFDFERISFTSQNIVSWGQSNAKGNNFK